MHLLILRIIYTPVPGVALYNFTGKPKGSTWITLRFLIEIARVTLMNLILGNSGFTCVSQSVISGLFV